MATLDALFEEIVTNDKGLVNVAAKAVDRHGKVFFFMAITHALIISTREGQLRSDGVFFLVRQCPLSKGCWTPEAQF